MTRTTKTTGRCRNRVRLGVECLETRDCMSANLVDGTLIITGNGSDNTVVVTQDDDQDTINVVENNGPAQQFDSSDVDHLSVNLKGGADRFTFQLGDADFERAKSMVIAMGGGDDSVSFKLDRQSDGDSANIAADLIISLAGLAGKDTLTANVGKIDHARFALHFTGGTGNDQGAVNLLGDLDDANTTVRLDGGAGNDRLTAIANDIDIDEESSMTMSLIGSFGFDTNVAVYAGELDGLLLVRNLGDADRDTVVANLITADDSDGQLDAIISGGANTVLPGGTVLLDVVALAVQVDPDEVTVLNLLQLQD